MGGFKRFLLFVHSVVGLLTVIFLGLACFDSPMKDLVAGFFSIWWVEIVFEVLAGITVLGLFVSLIRSIVSKRVDSVRVQTIDGGTITVTRDSIASQAARVVESDGSCKVDDVSVRARRNGKVRVNVRVLPHATVDVLKKGKSLHDELVLELKSICGNRLGKVSLEFLEPEETLRITRPSATTDIVPATTTYLDPAAETAISSRSHSFSDGASSGLTTPSEPISPDEME
ncbi:MAG: hypothetical protein IJM67_03630 [Atopobiaceae bacterium]|nr:hypothetical protein [Atopobiaceae bacterium]MBR3384853.1 hypothetical protein [Atopobiaceae bacterium]